MLEGFSSKELREQADDAVDDDEARAIESYRRKRLEEMRADQRRARFGEVYPIGRDDYNREVTEASNADEGDEDMKGKGTGVVCFLYKDGHPASMNAFQHLRTLARRHPRTKFVSIVGDKCIPNYPDKHLPSLFIYRKGEIIQQEVAWGAGIERSLEDLDKLLARTGVVIPNEKPLSRYQELDLDDDHLDDDNDHFGRPTTGLVNSRAQKNIRDSRRNVEDDDDDFDFDI